MSVEMKVRRAGWDKRSSAEVRTKLGKVLDEVEQEPSATAPRVKHKAKKKAKKAWYRCRVCDAALERSKNTWGDTKNGKCEGCGTREVKGSKACPSCKKLGVLLMVDGTVMCGSSLWHGWGCGFRGKPKKAA